MNTKYICEAGTKKKGKLNFKIKNFKIKICVICDMFFLLLTSVKDQQPTQNLTRKNAFCGPFS